MTTVTLNLRAIERLAHRAIVQELRLMTQEVLALRNGASTQDRAYADALLLKLDHLARSQQIEPITPNDSRPGPAAPAVRHEPPVAPANQDWMKPSPSRTYLVDFYGHEAGDLERVLVAVDLSAAVQLVFNDLTTRPRSIQLVVQFGVDDIRFVAADDMVLASIRICRACSPEITTEVHSACDALRVGDRSVLERLFARRQAAPFVTTLQRLVKRLAA